MRLAPVTLKVARPFVKQVHRRLPHVQGGMWAVAVRNADDVIVGVAIVGAAARMLPTSDLCILRVAVRPGHFNACSKLYGACSRAARAMGATNLITYTHADELGASLRASGFLECGMTKGGEHNRKSRTRAPAIDPRPKRRWVAAWSTRRTAQQWGGLA